MSEEISQEVTPEEVEETTEATTVEETSTEDTQAEDNAEETEEESGEETAEQPPKKKGIEKRFSDLTAQRKAAEQYAARLEEQNRILFERAHQLEASRQPPEVQAPPAPTTLPDRYDFDDDAQYQQAVNAYMDAQFQNRIRGLQDQAREKKAQEEQQKQAAEASKRVTQISETGASKYDDFAEVAYIPNALLPIVASTENAEEIAYRWGKNPTEWQALMEEAQANPYAVAAKIGRIDAELSAREKKQTKAPPPVKPLGGRAEHGGDPDKMSTAEWMKWREAQLKK